MVNRLKYLTMGMSALLLVAFGWKRSQMKVWRALLFFLGLIAVACNLALADPVYTPQPVEVTRQILPPGPSPTPVVCTALPPGMVVVVEAVDDPRAGVRVNVDVEGLEGAETPMLLFERLGEAPPGRTVTSAIHVGPVQPVGGDGRLTVKRIGGFDPPENGTDHWILKVVHARGVACVEFELPPTGTEPVFVMESFYVAEAFNFRLAIPDGYRLSEYEHPDAWLVASLYEESLLAEQVGHRPEIFVTVHGNPQQLTVQEWLEAHTAEGVTDTYPVYVGPRNVQAQNIAGRDALTFEDMTFSHAYVTLIEGDGYILATGFVPYTYPGLAEAFEQLLESLTFGE
jgi:hypothetical protein